MTASQVLMALGAGLVGGLAVVGALAIIILWNQYTGRR